MKTNIRTLLQKTLFFMVILVLTATSAANAAEKPADKPQIRDTASEQSVSPAATESLSVRKQKAINDLQFTADTLGAIAQKVSKTIGYLSGASVDVTTAQAALLKAQTTILSANVALSVLAKTPVVGDTIPDGYKEKVLDEGAVKTSIGDIQNQLFLARQSIIESLTALKTSINK
jgi:hypothetical protein